MSADDSGRRTDGRADADNADDRDLTSYLRRRPSGETPPLPREFTRVDRRVIAASAIVVVVLALLGAANRVTAWLDLIDEPISKAVAAMRTTATVDMARLISKATGPGAFKIYAAAIFVSLLVLKRHRRWIALFGALLATYSLQSVFVAITLRPRPYLVENTGNWAGFSFPSDSVTPFTALLVGACFCFFPRGRARAAGVAAVLVVLAAMSGAQILLGVDHMTDDVAGILIGASVMLFTYKWFVPDRVFPIRRGGGNSAHLDLGGPRGEAIRTALHDQLGFDVGEIKPFGLEGSAGSTPMLIDVGAERVFAKLYSTHHVRADRLYKLGRTLLYGRLEDEGSFHSVRRLVEYEDYMMRVMSAAGVPVVFSYGIVELTPEREYLLVTEFADGSREIGDDVVVVDEAIVDETLRAIRRMWDAGLSHRDIKPANLLVRDGHLVVIDVAFGSVRPSPWRQAVDLANAMLVLALRTDSDSVYRAAMRYFTPAEVAEAFAATKGMTVPSELRSKIHSDGRDLVSEFRSLAPGREPIPIQRWSLRRVALTAGVALGSALISILIVATVLGPDRGTVKEAECESSPSVVLSAQAVPDAQLVPCLHSLPTGWSVNETVITEDGTKMELANDRVGDRVLTLEFTVSCSTEGFVAFDAGPGRPAALRRVTDDGTMQIATTAYLLDGGCLVETLSVPSDLARMLSSETLEIIGFTPRTQLDSEIAARTDGRITAV